MIPHLEIIALPSSCYLCWMYTACIRCESWRHESGRSQDPVWLLFWWQNSWSLLFSNQFPVWVWFRIVVVQLLSLVWLCDLMDCSTLDFPVLHHLPELAQTHVHWVNDAIQPSHPLLSPLPPAFNLSQHQGLSQWVSSSHQMAKVLELQLQHQSFQWIFKVGFL